MKKLKKMMLISSIIMLISTIFVEATITRCISSRFKTAQEYFDLPILKSKLPIPREAIPPSLKGRIAKATKNSKKQKSKNLDCNTSISLCASFDSNVTENVSAWLGFEFESNKGKYFVATYSQKANHLGNGLYATPKWDKHHFWMYLGENIVPFPIQPRFVGSDTESDNEWYVVDYLGYRMNNIGIDYSNYWENMSQSALILLINPQTKKVEEYYIEYYDENDEYVGVYSIEIGDEIESYFLGFRKGQEDREYFFSLEDITKVTSGLTFSYKEQYPQKDFNTTYGQDLNLAEAEFKYIFESYGKTRSTFTEPQPIEKKEVNTTESASDNVTPSSSKSVPLSGFWILFMLTLIIAIFNLQNEKNFK